MNYKININNKIYKIKKLSELSISEYNKIFNIIEKNDFRKLLYMLTNIPSEYINYISDDSLYKIEWIKILNEPFNIKKIKNKYLDRNLLNLDKIKVGRYIDMDYILTKKEDDKLEYIMAYLIQNEDEEIKTLVEEIKEKLKLVDIIEPVNYFINWRKNLIKTYQSLFQKIEYDEDEDEDEDEEYEEEDEINETDFGWLGVVYDSAGPALGSIDDVFNRTLFEFLNYLSWKKQKIEKEIEQQKIEQQKINF